VRGEAGLAANSSILLLTAVLAGPGRPLGAAACLLTVTAGLLILAVALRKAGPALWGAPGTWRRVVLMSLFVGLLAGLALTSVGGQGWAVRLLLIPATGIWAASGGLWASADRRAFFLAPVLALVSLLLLTALGYAIGAGILYFVGPPLALCLILAGHYLADPSVRPKAAGNAYLNAAYVAAALAVTLSAWVDLV
jgi:hypothetical protein